jgi:hypothetical protein
MAFCPNYEVSPGFQLQSGGATGPYDCTAWAARTLIATATCGAKVVSGRTIRLRSSEPIPDMSSPGLNLPQVAAVASRYYGVYMDLQIGSQRVTFAEYERRRKAGQPTIIQVGYAPIAASKYNAGRGFRGNHAIAETTHATYDPLADGRAAGVFRHNGTVYDRNIIKTAAGMLDIGGRRVGYGYVWAAFGRDVVPTYRVALSAQYFWTYKVDSNGRITGRTRSKTGGFSASCTAPGAYYWPFAGKYYRLVQLTSGSRKGQWIAASFAEAYP